MCGGAGPLRHPLPPKAQGGQNPGGVWVVSCQPCCSQLLAPQTEFLSQVSGESQGKNCSLQDPTPYLSGNYLESNAPAMHALSMNISNTEAWHECYCLRLSVATWSSANYFSKTEVHTTTTAADTLVETQNYHFS